jgi:hypothetical protein
LQSTSTYRQSSRKFYISSVSEYRRRVNKIQAVRSLGPSRLSFPTSICSHDAPIPLLLLCTCRPGRCGRRSTRRSSGPHHLLHDCSYWNTLNDLPTIIARTDTRGARRGPAHGRNLDSAPDIHFPKLHIFIHGVHVELRPLLRVRILHVFCSVTGC